MSSPPEGTKPWRKTWRRRWRPDSTYRQLTCLQARILAYVEDNADDDGSVVTTSRFLADIVTPQGRGFRPVSHVTVWRAVKDMVSLGLLSVEPARELVSKVKQNSQHPPTRITRLKYSEYQKERVEAETELDRKLKRSSRGMQRKAEKKIPSGGSPAATATTFAALAHWGFSLDAKTRTVVARRVKEGMPPDEVLARCVVARAERFASGRVIDNPMVAVGSGMDGFFKTREREVSSVRREFGEWAARVRASGSGGDGAGTAETLPEDHPRLSLVGSDGEAQHPQVHRPGGQARDVQNDPGLDLGRLDGDLGANCTVDLPGNVPWPNEFYGLVTTQQH